MISRCSASYQTALKTSPTVSKVDQEDGNRTYQELKLVIGAVEQLARLVEYSGRRQCRYLQAMMQWVTASWDTFGVWLGHSRQPIPYCTGGLHCSERIGCRVHFPSCFDRTFADVGCIVCRFGVA